LFDANLTPDTLICVHQVFSEFASQQSRIRASAIPCPRKGILPAKPIIIHSGSIIARNLLNAGVSSVFRQPVETREQFKFMDEPYV